MSWQSFQPWLQSRFESRKTSDECCCWLHDEQKRLGNRILTNQVHLIREDSLLTPDLSQSRKVRQSPPTSAPSAPIQANLVCPDCDPGGGGGAGGTDPYFGTARTRPINQTGTAGVTLGSRNFNWGLPLV